MFPSIHPAPHTLLAFHPKHSVFAPHPFHCSISLRAWSREKKRTKSYTYTLYGIYVCIEMELNSFATCKNFNALKSARAHERASRKRKHIKILHKRSNKKWNCESFSICWNGSFRKKKITFLLPTINECIKNNVVEIKINAIEAQTQTHIYIRTESLRRCNMKLAATAAANTNGGKKWNDNRKLWER